ncbi:hypothetical protein [Achromobacter xylosoxidans]|uniref:Restriction endonuclease type IV Mrr domain-containing protein n=1 Tax=Alcaligenes xylosoxydans xylosoxydans TaxID=85698 RepID=A0A424WB36_ALCXX|nr:hypothetical protein [Achromobacter xylosoxidans]MBC9904871.1 hypothetical protein [Achromobacter xylosoxidans]MBD0868787.1 hypothetical protein [Achromobacter xylosoxidans]QNP87715.1 hypothetical protein IAG39_09475 [Achromobacter xylosoxidans]RPJ90391.1 hypothetical protein DY367_18015 [Achromobacter xylosoxidans]
MILDEAAERERDVDVTVKITDENGEISAFKASEVKHERAPLDVVAVEQLIIKLNDMPDVTHKAIFSTSGYSSTACKKAASYNVDLYTLQPWDVRIEDEFPDFPGVGKPGEFLSQFSSSLLCWPDHRIIIHAPDGPTTFAVDDPDTICTFDGSVHPTYRTFGDYVHAILMRSTGILLGADPAWSVHRTFPYVLHTEGDVSVGPAWPHTHTLDVRADAVYLRLRGGTPFLIEGITVSGHLQWQRRNVAPEFHILRRVGDNTIFAGAAIASYTPDDRRMFAMVFPDRGRELGIHQFEIPEKQKNMIRKLKIKG